MSSRSRRSAVVRPLLVTIVLVGVFGTGRIAAQGLIPTDPEELNRVPEYEPKKVQIQQLRTQNGVKELYVEVMETVAAPPPPRVDLTEFLPPVGDQGQIGSCVGWAVSRAITAQVTRYRRVRQPNAPHHEFSPYFIYNQINRGRDQGAQIYSEREAVPCAVKLAIRRGCSSTSTMGLAPDFTAQPSAQARTEAANYRAYDHEKITSLDGIKQALARNYPVILGVKTDDGFHRLNGPQVYQWTGVVANGRHGYHAVCLVGYDDARRSVRLLNSWGDRWGDRGYAWVGYDNLQTIGAAGWCFQAHVVKVMDQELPQYANVPRSRKRYYLDDMKALFEVGRAAPLTGPNFAERIAATHDWMYGVTADGRVVTVARVVNGAITIDQPRDISTADWPAGLTQNGRRPEVTMIACSDRYLFALSRDGRLFRRLPSPPQPTPVWQEIPYTQPADRNIDLRNFGGEVTVTKQSGRVRIWGATAEKWSDYSPDDIRPVAMPLLRP